MSKEHMSYVRGFDQRSADYVVAHAGRQVARGRKPSAYYKGESNPRVALELAQEDLASRSANRERIVHGYNEMAGRVAVLHVVDGSQVLPASQFGNRMVDTLAAAGYDIAVDHPDYDRSRGIHPNEDGTFDISYHWS
jgi:hypothetical protein